MKNQELKELIVDNVCLLICIIVLFVCAVMINKCIDKAFPNEVIKPAAAKAVGFNYQPRFIPFSSIQSEYATDTPKPKKHSSPKKHSRPKKHHKPKHKAPSQQSKKHLTKRGGVCYFNGYKETWYSQQVLPGKGLKIPGRHVDSQGLVKDKNNYIVIASNNLSKGTVITISLGKAKVYDHCPTPGVIDVYTNW